MYKHASSVPKKSCVICRHYLFLPHSDAAERSMQERLRYNNSRLQKGTVCIST